MIKKCELRRYVNSKLQKAHIIQYKTKENILRERKRESVRVGREIGENEPRFSYFELNNMILEALRLVEIQISHKLISLESW